jgi:hypothetical protein
MSCSRTADVCPVNRTRVLGLALVAAAIPLAIAGALIRVGDCQSGAEALQPFAIAAALCGGAGVALLSARHRWVWGIGTALLVYAVLWVRWIMDVGGDCLN